MKKKLFLNEFLSLTGDTIGRTGASKNESALVRRTLGAVSSKACGAVVSEVTGVTTIMAITESCEFTWFTSYSMLKTNVVKIISQFYHPG